VAVLGTTRQSPQKKWLAFMKRRNEPVERGLCVPHLMQLIISPVLPVPSKGEPFFFVL
jgi:hypothetical protein